VGHVARVGAPRAPVGYSAPLERVARVDEARIVQAGRKLVKG